MTLPPSQIREALDATVREHNLVTITGSKYDPAWGRPSYWSDREVESVLTMLVYLDEPWAETTQDRIRKGDRVRLVRQFKGGTISITEGIADHNDDYGTGEAWHTEDLVTLTATPVPFGLELEWERLYSISVPQAPPSPTKEPLIVAEGRLMQGRGDRYYAIDPDGESLPQDPAQITDWDRVKTILDED